MYDSTWGKSMVKVNFLAQQHLLFFAGADVKLE